jgi:uncharacterized protein (DUF1778 family)
MAVAVKRRKPKVERKEEALRLRLTSEEKKAWTLAAEKDGRDLSNWLRFLANRETERIDVKG